MLAHVLYVYRKLVLCHVFVGRTAVGRVVSCVISRIAENAAAFDSSKVEVGECALSRNGIVHSLPTA